MTISLPVDKVYVHERPPKVDTTLHRHAAEPKRRIDDKPESPEGESLLSSLIFTTEASVNAYSCKSRNKKGLEPKFKGVCKKSVLIEI